MDDIKRLPSDVQDSYMPDPDTEDRVACGVCGTEMHVNRGCFGPTSFVSAIGGSKRKHDAFFCPNRDKDWHKQVVALRREAKKTASSRLAAMLVEEAEQILEQKEPTKVGYWTGCE